MADNVLMAYHIVHDPDGRTKHVLNTKNCISGGLLNRRRAPQ